MPDHAVSARSESSSGSYWPLLIAVFATVVLLAVLVSLWSHWDYTLTATPKDAASATPVASVVLVAPATETGTPTAPPAPIPAATPTMIPPPAAIAPVAIMPATTPPDRTTAVFPRRVRETPTYVNLIIVDWVSGFPQFPVFEGVLAPIKREGKMVKFVCDGKTTTTFSCVLESDPYTEGEPEQIGAISVPDKNNFKKMIMFRAPQSSRNVFSSPFGLYYKTGSGIIRAPENSTFSPRPVSVSVPE